jgi:hypothetical protein
LSLAAQNFGEVTIDGRPVLGQFDGRLDQTSPGQSPVSLMGGPVSGQLSRHRNGQTT